MSFAARDPYWPERSTEPRAEAHPGLDGGLSGSKQVIWAKGILPLETRGESTRAQVCMGRHTTPRAGKQETALFGFPVKREMNKTIEQRGGRFE